LIDRANHHLFQPLLYQVATAGLSPSDIAAPVRPLFRASMNTQVLLGSVSGIDTVGQRVLLGHEAIPYDYLVLATGATHSYFGNDAWAAYAPGLKRIEDAIEIRRRILIAFERAEATADAVERAALLTFLIVGGGPTGVELAGAIAELARFGMDKDFRNFDPADARVILVQSAARLLPVFPEILSMRAQRSLEKLNVEVLIGSPVQRIDAVGVAVNGKSIVARTVLWAAGVKASPAAKWLRARSDNAGRVKVAADLSVPNLKNVYVIGDTAASNGWRGQSVPGLASAAKQGGRYAARQIRSKIDGTPAPAAFAYLHLGSLATIGRKAAVADFGFIKLWGAPAWWLWGAVHVGFLLGIRNRLATMMNWFWSYLTLGGGIRLITDPEVPSLSPNDKSVDSSTSTIVRADPKPVKEVCLDDSPRTAARSLA
jgi:NADH dehydrogenase FAD-containing subunit